jgi:succinate-semialdehyde dehydrogenase/glutarate-semialdehyde dehydrogenase
VVYPLLIGGAAVETDTATAVVDKFTGAEVAAVADAGPGHVDAACAAAWEAHTGESLAPHRRHQILRGTAAKLAERRTEFVETLVAETGFTVADAEADFRRTLDTLELSAHEATRLAGEMVPLSGAQGQEHRIGFTLKLPIGPVCAITPFNSPLNTVAHKIGPAIAAGNPFVLKPALATPISAYLLCKAMEEAGLPHGWASLLFGTGPALGPALMADPRLRYYAFTGSTDVGRVIQREIGLRRSQMELGAISATIVCSDADLEVVIPKALAAAFRKAGQVCTSLQRLIVHEALADELIARLGAAASSLVAGDPRAPGTDVGPMISEAEAMRAEQWVQEAVAAGACAHTPVAREGAVLAPVVLSDVTPEMKVMADEIFAPVMSVVRFGEVDEAFAIVNDTPYGLSAGIFTSDWKVALRAAHELQVGVVQVDETSSSRVDLMPYGGARDSGFGKEGPRYAADEMSFERLVIFNR